MFACSYLSARLSVCPVRSPALPIFCLSFRSAVGLSCSLTWPSHFLSVCAGDVEGDASSCSGIQSLLQDSFFPKHITCA